MASGWWSVAPLSWTGKPTEGNIARGFAEKWANYEDAWDLLEL